MHRLTETWAHASPLAGSCNMTDSISEDDEKPRMSRTRKIILWIFVIGFWFFYYWYEGPTPPAPEPQNAQEIPEKTSPAPPAP